MWWKKNKMNKNLIIKNKIFFRFFYVFICDDVFVYINISVKNGIFVYNL